MQGKPIKAEVGGKIFYRAFGAVSGVAYHRMASYFGMTPDLMLSTGQRFTCDKRIMGRLFRYPVTGSALLFFAPAFRAIPSAALLRKGPAPQCPSVLLGRRQGPVQDGDIPFYDASGPELIGEI